MSPTLPSDMRAMRIERIAPWNDQDGPLAGAQVPVPEPEADEVLVRVRLCGVCHTELDELEGRAPPLSLPMIPGHQVVGEVVAAGEAVDDEILGQRVGVAWIHHACGHCVQCESGRENLCPDFVATGRDAPGGYAEYLAVPSDFVHPLPADLADEQAAPLLCAGAVGWRALRQCRLEDGEPLGLTGFGASGHLVLQMAAHRYPDSPLLVFARNPDERAFARELGAHWAGDTDAEPPVAPAAIVDTTPAWKPVLCALAALRPGGRLVINAIGKEAGDRDWLKRLDYQRHLWREKEIATVANVTRRDVRECLAAAVEIPLVPSVTCHPLADANKALAAIRAGGLRGAHVLEIG